MQSCQLLREGSHQAYGALKQPSQTSLPPHSAVYRQDALMPGRPIEFQHSIADISDSKLRKILNPASKHARASSPTASELYRQGELGNRSPGILLASQKSISPYEAVSNNHSSSFLVDTNIKLIPTTMY